MANNQILSSLEDINGFLPDLVEITDGEDRQAQIDANRVVKSQLSGVFSPATLTGWAAPGSTPQLIRGIAGRLIAAKWYSQQFSQETTEVPRYAQGLYNEAIGMLNDIKRGILTVVDDDNEPISSGSSLALTSSDLNPNNSSADPVFGMTLEFG